MKMNETAGSKAEAILVQHVIRVLFVEDDGDFREALAGDLSDRGLAVECPDGASLLSAPDTAVTADVNLLDWGLRGTSGIDPVPELRRRGIALPVVRGRWRNNRAENSHQPTRRRERKMQGFKSRGSAQRFLSTHAAVYNAFCVQRHLTSASTHRTFRTTAMRAWQAAVAVA